MYAPRFTCDKSFISSCSCLGIMAYSDESTSVLLNDNTSSELDFTEEDFNELTATEKAEIEKRAEENARLVELMNLGE